MVVLWILVSMNSFLPERADTGATADAIAQLGKELI
jgi:hypothetical protein